MSMTTADLAPNRLALNGLAKRYGGSYEITEEGMQLLIQAREALKAILEDLERHTPQNGTSLSSELVSASSPDQHTSQQ